MMSGPLLLLSLLLNLNAQSEAFDPAFILANLELPGEQIQFTETRISGLLSEPLIVRGSLRRSDNGDLIRETTSPSQETQTLGSNFVELRRSSGYRRRFSLDRAPELAALRTILLALLDGQMHTLSDDFSISGIGSSVDWQISLAPRRDLIAERLDKIVLLGQTTRLNALVLRFEDGSEVKTQFDTGLETDTEFNPGIDAGIDAESDAEISTESPPSSTP